MLLEGYRLLDLSQSRPPGASCTHMLADLGMEVIRIDLVQSETEGFVREGRALAFDALNRNKRSLALNLRTDAGKEVFYKLVATSDAVLEGSRPGAAKRLGVDYESLKAINPRIVYCSISGYGQDGPYALVGAHDTEASAMRGAFGRTNDSVMTPSYFGVLMADIGGGLHGAVGILAGLLGAVQRGEGCYMDIALADAVTSFNIGKLQSLLMNGSVPKTSHMDRVFLKCKDGKYIAQANVEPHNWSRFCTALGRQDLLELPRADAATRARMIEDLRAVMLTRTRDEWFQEIAATGATVAPCLELEEVIDDPQVRHRGLIWELDHPTEGRVQQWGFPIRVDGEEARLRKFAPAAGEDTESILQELGYTPADVESLRSSGAIKK
jgi:crotonobetainyl-CoA:carnitine CoA-transferase CaiB-like acyl-CoA transferase